MSNKYLYVCSMYGLVQIGVTVSSMCLSICILHQACLFSDVSLIDFRYFTSVQSVCKNLWKKRMSGEPNLM